MSYGLKPLDVWHGIRVAFGCWPKPNGGSQKAAEAPVEMAVAVVQP
jgi:hypothetical protein